MTTLRKLPIRRPSTIAAPRISQGGTSARIMGRRGSSKGVPSIGYDAGPMPAHSAAPPRAASLRRAKIVCTVGPASSTPAQLDALMIAGMDVARLNFSHGTHEEHAARLKAIREAAT